jgi:lipopolysaccharide export LptBFGC system permease protein LptF
LVFIYLLKRETPGDSLIMSRYWTLWRRHLFRQILLQTTLTLGLLLALYSFIDASIHLYDLKKLSQFNLLINHYAAIFIKRTPQLLPFALLFTSVRILLNMQKHHELISLRMSGASKFSILIPFLAAGFFASCLNWSLNEGLWTSPIEMKSVNFNPISWLSSSWHFGNQEPLEAIPLDDKLESWLIFHQYDQEKREFGDVFWIKNDQEWWHFKELILQNKNRTISTAIEADCFQLQPSGERFWSGHFDTLDFHLVIQDSQLITDLKPAQELNVFDLYQSLQKKHPQIQSSKLKGYLYFRMLQPLLCLLAPLAAASATLRYSRQLPTLMAYIISGSILAMTLMLQQSGLLLATSGRIHPLFSIGLVTLTIFFLTGYAVKRA